MCTAFTIDLDTIACMHASRADRVKFSDSVEFGVPSSRRCKGHWQSRQSKKSHRSSALGLWSFTSQRFILLLI